MAKENKNQINDRLYDKVGNEIMTSYERQTAQGVPFEEVVEKIKVAYKDYYFVKDHIAKIVELRAAGILK